MGLLRPVEFADPHLRARLADQRRGQPLFDQPLPQPVDLRLADLERVGDRRIRPARPRLAHIGLQAYARAQDFLRRRPSRREHRFQPLPLRPTQPHHVLGIRAHAPPPHPASTVDAHT